MSRSCEVDIPIYVKVMIVLGKMHACLFVTGGITGICISSIDAPVSYLPYVRWPLTMQRRKDDQVGGSKSNIVQRPDRSSTFSDDG